MRFKIKGERQHLLHGLDDHALDAAQSNVALCVNANEDYARIQAGTAAPCIMAKALVKAVVGDDEIEEIKHLQGQRTGGHASTSRCSTYAEPAAARRPCYVVADSYVTHDRRYRHCSHRARLW